MSKLDKYNPEIAEKVRSGKYYKEAWDWYALKYIYPVSQRTLFIFVTLAAITVTVSALVILYNFYPLKIRVPVAVNIEDMGLDYARLVKMQVPVKGDPTVPVADYLVREYVTKIETYNFKQIDRHLRFLSQFSSPGLMEEIQKRYDTRNLDSLILKYRDHTTRTIRITQMNVTMDPLFDIAKARQKDIVLENVLYHAIIEFESEEVNLLGVTQHKWQASMDFNMSPITLDKTTKTFKKLDFVVNSYSVRPVQ
jgi:type IV secretory pathway component VirB8